MCMGGDMPSLSSSSDRSAMLTELRSVMSSVSSSPVRDVSVLPRAFRRLPMLGSMCTSIPHIFHKTLRVHVPALLLSGELNGFVIGYRQKVKYEVSIKSTLTMFTFLMHGLYQCTLPFKSLSVYTPFQEIGVSQFFKVCT